MRVSARRSLTVNEPLLASLFERSLCFPQSSRSVTEWMLGTVILQNSCCSFTGLAAGSKRGKHNFFNNDNSD